MFSFIVAMDENKAIGYKNSLPWSNLDELNHFKQLTMNKVLIMGSNTFNNLPKTLKGRKILVASKSLGDIKNLEDFLKNNIDSKEEYIIAGGKEIYTISYPFCKKAYVSFIKGKHQADTYFDSFDINDFEIIKQENHHSFDYFELKRKNM